MSMSIPVFPTPYYMISWPGFQLQSAEYLLPVNKQENRPCHVSLELPHSSLICENMYSGQRFQAFPWDPVSLQSSLAQTCKQTHVIKSTSCFANTICSQGKDRVTFTYMLKTCMVVMWACDYLHANFYLLLQSCEADHLTQLQWNTYQPRKQRRALAVPLLSITSSFLHK